MFKMRVLFYSQAGNAERVAQTIARQYKTTSDQIPPAYPTDNEKLLIICVEAGGKPDKQVADFCRNLTTARARNIAFLIINKSGDDAAAKMLAESVKARGINVIPSIHIIKVGGLIKQSAVKQGDVDSALAWAAKIIDDLTEK